MKKNAIALLLAVVMASGSIGTVPALAAESTTQESVALEEESVEDAEEESAETEDAGTGVVSEDTTETESVDETEEVPEQESTEKTETTEEVEEGTTEVEDKVAALAESGDVVDSGDCSATADDHVTWEITRNDETAEMTLTISGTGKIKNYYINEWPWGRYRTSITSAMIESGVTNIGDYTFYSCAQLSSITISDTVTSIGYEPFYDCDSLISVSIPASVTSIGELAFHDCSSLEAIYVDDKNMSFCDLSGVLFDAGMESLIRYPSSKSDEVYTIPDGVVNIEACAFSHNATLTNVIIPNSVENIGDSAFVDCSSLINVAIPDSVTSLGKNSFCSCTSLSNVVIPDSVTNIGESSFSGCSSLARINIPNSITNIDRQTFSSCTSLTDVYIPDSVTSIGNSAFYGCISLESIDLPDSITSIWQSAFCDCTSLTSLDLPKNLENLGFYFLKNTAVTSITIPKSLSNVYTKDYSYTRGPFEDSNVQEVIFEEGITVIPDYTCYKARTVTNVTIPDSVIAIGKNAFDYCLALLSVTISNNVTSVGERAFEYCTSLKNVTIPESINSIPWRMFYYCTSLENVSIADGITKIGDSSFSYCTSLTEITIPGSVTQIDSYSFSNCTALTDIVISEGVATINEAFNNCSALTAIVLPASVTNIYGHSFNGCSSLERIEVNSNNPSFCAYDNVLFSKDMSELVCYPAGKIQAEFQVPITVSAVGSNAFSGCHNLSDIYFCGPAPTFYYNSFTNNTANVYYPENDSTWTDSVRQNYGGTITWLPWNPTLNKNETIIERVREYTSDDVYAQLNSIISSDDPDEVKFHHMNALFTYYGFTDAKEGVHYLSNTHDKRYAYLMLTTDETYCANNYVDWLNSGSLAGTRRALLVADGLIFNNEINDWLSFTTYVESEYPGVKKYKTMLYDFMDTTSKSLEIQSGIKFANDLASKCTGVAKIEAENIVNSLNSCESIAEERNILSRAESEEVYVELAEERDENGNILLKYQLDESSGFGQFQKMMGYATKTLSITKMSISDIMDLIEFDSKLATYSQYKRFLQEVVADTSVPFQMRWAASLIITELDEGYLSQIEGIAMDIIGQTELNSTVKKAILSKLGVSSLSSWLTMIEIGSFFANQVANIGDMVKNEAYVEGYYYLSKSYKNRLEEAKAEFQNNQTEANAWNFYYNYNILYNLRHKGEEAYLKFSKINGIAAIFSDFGYSDKKAVVNNTIKLLEERCRFTFDGAKGIPESCQFATKAVVKCPVDVDIVASDGTVMASLTDGEESDETNSYGRFAVVYDHYSGDYYKVICLNQDDDFTLRAKGSNRGLVNIELAKADDEKQEVYAINNVPIEPEEVISTTVSQVTEENTITRYTEAEPEGVEEEVIVTAGTYVSAESISLDPEELSLNTGESALLSVSFNPAGASNQGVLWTSTDPEVAAVTDGRVEAVSEGTATVYCIAQDNCELIKTCTVSVADPVHPIDGCTVEGIVNETFTGSPITQKLTLKDGDTVLTQDTDYTVSYANNKSVGTAAITITGIGNYTGTIEKTFEITPKQVTPTITLSKTSFIYNGKAQKPGVTANDEDVTLVNGTDYTATYRNNTNAGTASVVIKCKGNYTGTATKNFSIAKKPVSALKISGITNKTYNKKAQTQAVVVKNGTVTLKNGTDYSLSYKNNTNAGTASVIITGKGNYKGSVTKNFTIKKAVNKITAKSFTKVYSTSTQSFALGVKIANGTPKYASNTKSVTVSAKGVVTIKPKFIGKAVITITAPEYKNYSKTTKKITVTVNPTKTGIASVTSPAAGQMLVKWKKNAVGTGYQIQYSTSSKFNGVKSAWITKNTIVSKKVTNLTKGKKYYVRMRTYKTVGGVKYYSGWCTVKAVTIKK